MKNANMDQPFSLKVASSLPTRNKDDSQNWRGPYRSPSLADFLRAPPDSEPIELLLEA
jgi:hypothetical protein